jgi:hypothetical protein
MIVAAVVNDFSCVGWMRTSNGVFQRFELKPWKLVFSNAELLRTSG